MKTVRRFLTVAAVAALTTTGLGAVAPGVANAAEECKQSASFKDGTWTYNKKIDVAEVAPGGTVDAKLEVVSGPAPTVGVRRLTDVHPKQLEIQNVSVRAWTGINYVETKNHRFDTESPTRATVRNDNDVFGWSVLGGNLSAVFTYKVSEDAKPGELLKVPSGMIVGYSSGKDTVNENLDVCVKVREKNPVEAVTGSLDSAGLGSATGSADGGSAGSQISSDPAGFIADIINQINLGKLIGLS